MSNIKLDPVIIRVLQLPVSQIPPNRIFEANRQIYGQDDNTPPTTISHKIGNGVTPYNQLPELLTHIGDYVQNQNANAQAGNFWIGGDGKVDGTIKVGKAPSQPTDVVRLQDLELANKILSGMTTSVVGNTMTVQPGTWRINNLIYLLSSAATVILDAQDATLSRFDVIYVDTTNNTLHLMSGNLAANPDVPEIPADAVLISTVLVTPTSVTTTQPPQQQQTVNVNNGLQMKNGYIQIGGDLVGPTSVNISNLAPISFIEPSTNNGIHINTSGWDAGYQDGTNFTNIIAGKAQALIGINQPGKQSYLALDYSSGITIADQIFNTGMLYKDDYSALGELSDLWIPNWGAVKRIASTSLNFSNGLTLDTGNVTWGGSLTGNTNIDTQGNRIFFTDTSSNYSSNFVAQFKGNYVFPNEQGTMGVSCTGVNLQYTSDTTIVNYPTAAIRLGNDYSVNNVNIEMYVSNTGGTAAQGLYLSQNTLNKGIRVIDGLNNIGLIGHSSIVGQGGSFLTYPVHPTMYPYQYAQYAYLPTLEQSVGAFVGTFAGQLANFNNSTTNTPGAIIAGNGTNHVLGRWNGTHWIVVGGDGSNPLTLNNGLTLTTGNIAQLGGTISQATNVDPNGYALTFNSTNNTSSFQSLIKSADTTNQGNLSLTTTQGILSATDTVNNVSSSSHVWSTQSWIQTSAHNNTTPILSTFKTSYSTGTDTVAAYMSVQLPAGIKSIAMDTVITGGIGIYVTDNLNSFGFNYAADYSAVGKLNDRWLPDWGTVKTYVTSIANNGFTFENGIAAISTNIYGLGGPLMQNTTITTTNYALATADKFGGGLSIDDYGFYYGGMAGDDNSAHFSALSVGGNSLTWSGQGDSSDTNNPMNGIQGMTAWVGSVTATPAKFSIKNKNNLNINPIYYDSSAELSQTYTGGNGGGYYNHVLRVDSDGNVNGSGTQWISLISKNVRNLVPNVGSAADVVNPHFGISVGDSISNVGFYYANNYFAQGSIDDRWIPDWAAVKSAISSGFTFTNGLTNNSGTVILGGSLLQATNIDPNGNFLTFSSTNDNSAFESQIKSSDATKSSSVSIVAVGAYLNSSDNAAHTSTTVNALNNSLFIQTSAHNNTAPITSTFSTGYDTTASVLSASMQLSNSGTFREIRMNNTPGTGILVTDTLDLFGLYYAADYSVKGKLNNLWIPNWGAVTGAISAAAYTNGDGLSLSGNKFSLGGSLTADATLTLNTKRFIVNDPLNTHDFFEIGNGYFYVGEGVGASNHSYISMIPGQIELLTMPAGGTPSYGVTTTTVSDGVTIGYNTASGNTQLQFLGSGAIFTDTIHTLGFVYAADYSVNGKANNRWIPDWGAVQSAISTAVGGVPAYTFSNGITNDTGNITLGGSISGVQNIDASSGNFSFSTTYGNYSDRLFISDGGINLQTTDNTLGSDAFLSATNGYVLLQATTASNHSNNFTVAPGAAAQWYSQDLLPINYYADYSANFTARSLIDKGYADGHYSSITPAWSSITGKPTTLSGYGITDAYPLTGNPSGFLTTSSAASTYLPLTGGTLSSTLTLPSEVINGVAGTTRDLQWRTNNALRWDLYANATAESGSNAGSDLILNGFSDDGATAIPVYSVKRSTGVLDFKINPTINGSATGLEPNALHSTSTFEAKTGVLQTAGLITNSPVGANGIDRTDPQLVVSNLGDTTKHALIELYNGRGWDEAAITFNGLLSNSTNIQNAATFVRYVNDVNTFNAYHVVHGFHQVGYNEDYTTLDLFSNNSVGLIDAATSSAPWNTLPRANSVRVGVSDGKALDINGSLNVMAASNFNLPSTGKSISTFYRIDGSNDYGLIQSIDNATSTLKPLLINASQITFGGNIISPAFTGTPTAPTPATTDNSNTLATTAYVQANFDANAYDFAPGLFVGRNGAGDSGAAGSLTNPFVLGSAVVGITQLSATGTPSASTYLRGDNTWATIPAGNAGTVTSITAGTGLTGGTITSSGTIATDYTSTPTWTGSHIWQNNAASNTLTPYITLANNTTGLTASGTVYYSPTLSLLTQVWDGTSSTNLEYRIGAQNNQSNNFGYFTISVYKGGVSQGTIFNLDNFGNGFTSASWGVHRTGVATSTTFDGLTALNFTSSTSGAVQQNSPVIRYMGSAWNTTATAANNWIEWTEGIRTGSGTTPTSAFVWAQRRSTNNSGSYTDVMSLDNSSNLSLLNTVSTKHIIGSSSAPTIAAGTGAGTSPTVSISGTDMSGTISVTTGTSPTGSNAILATITFNVAYGAAPRVQIDAGNRNAQALAIGAIPLVPITGQTNGVTTTTFVIETGATALAASTSYIWSYFVIQ